MFDKLGREINHLRISLTNKCNLDCFYCHKEGNNSNQNNDPEISTQKIYDLLDEAKLSGVKTIKFTGGEPLLRKDIFEIIKYSENQFKIGITTNGSCLEESAQKLFDSGLRNINVGCDAVSEILPKNLVKLKSGIIKAKKTGLNVKLNMVLLNGINNNEISGMISFCKNNELNLQLIELIKFDTFLDYEKYYYSLEGMEDFLSKNADSVEIRKMQDRKRFLYDNNYIEIIRPRQDFCKSCNKIRVNSNGKYKPCLMKDTVTNSLKLALNARDYYGYD